MAAPPTSPTPGLRIVGVLGGVGSGKSTVARDLAAALGEPDAVLDADLEVGRLLASAEVAEAVAAAFGPAVLDREGAVDRRALAARVFADPAARRRLEALLHPAVRVSLHERLEERERAGARWAILDVPLLLERGLDRLCDFLVFVDVSAAERQRRACRRHGWSPAEWAAREAVQASLPAKKARADAILSNEGAADRLAGQIQEFARRLQGIEPRPLAERWPRADQDPT